MQPHEPPVGGADGDIVSDLKEDGHVGLYYQTDRGPTAGCKGLGNLPGDGDADGAGVTGDFEAQCLFNEVGDAVAVGVGFWTDDRGVCFAGEVSGGPATVSGGGEDNVAHPGIPGSFTPTGRQRLIGQRPITRNFQRDGRQNRKFHGRTESEGGEVTRVRHRGKRLLNQRRQWRQ